ncbi:MAG: response regulator [Candidatus Didemnitutus sp.]|nr:response regulator [Candidatus Didemnitutus sp.]
MRLRILTVDDAKAVRLLAERALSPFACETAEATNGFNALYAMEKALPDLVLLDVSMPVMGGLELLEMMRSNDTLRDLPVIMLTSPADHAILGRLAELGISGKLVKPFRPEALVAAVRAVVKLSPRH